MLAVETVFIPVFNWTVLVLWLHHSSFNRHLTDVHLDCFQSFAFTNGAAVKILVHSLFLIFANTALGSIPRSQIAGSKDKCMFSGRYHQIAPYGVVLFCIPQLFLHSLTDRVCYCIFGLCQSQR